MGSDHETSSVNRVRRISIGNREEDISRTFHVYCIIRILHFRSVCVPRRVVENISTRSIP